MTAKGLHSARLPLIKGQALTALGSVNTVSTVLKINGVQTNQPTDGREI